MIDEAPPSGEHLPQPESPTVWRRWLAVQLRRLRVDKGLTQRQAGKAAGRTHVHISNVETAVQAVGLPDLEALLDAYGVADEDCGIYLTAAERSRVPGWWERYDRSDVPDWLSLYVGLEQGAAGISAYNPTVIPGLLQTADYARALFASAAVTRTGPHIERLVKFRVDRQAIITRDHKPLELSVVLDESALLRPIGGRQVMADQLRHLTEIGRRPNIDIRVLTFDAGNPVSSHAFTIVDFPWPDDHGMVYLDLVSGGLFREPLNEVDAHRLVFDRLCAKAFSPADSITLIERLTSKWQPE